MQFFGFRVWGLGFRFWAVGFGLYGGLYSDYLGFRDITPTMEDQMEKKMEMQREETGMMQGFIRTYRGIQGTGIEAGNYHSV